MKKEKPWKTPRTCELPECGKTFTPGREWQKFCSDLCGGRARNQRKSDTQEQQTQRIAELEAEIQRLKASK